MNTDTTIELVREWGRQKGIIGPNASGTQRGQLYKLMEEVGELKHAIQIDDRDEKIDAIGDCTVVLILLAEMIEVPLEYCLDAAYQVISQRTGRMVDGQFVKDTNQ